MRIKAEKLIIGGALSSLLVACAGDRPNNLGAKNGLLALCPASPNCVSSQVREERHAIVPFVCNGDPVNAFARLGQMLKSRRDTKVVEESSGYLRVEFHTTLFVDDGEFLLDREHNVIHIRSASRLGYSDLGKNRSRLEEIRLEFAKKGG